MQIQTYFKIIIVLNLQLEGEVGHFTARFRSLKTKQALFVFNQN